MIRNTILLLLFSINCFSQIAIEKPENKDKIKKSLVAEFNEKIDLYEYKTAEQFLGLIGKELFFLPENPKYDFILDQYESISYLPKNKFKLGKKRYRANQLVNLKKWDKELIDFLELKENYFVVDSIQFYDNTYSWRKKISGYDFKEIQKKYSSDFSLGGSVDIYTHHKKNNKIIIFNISNKSSAEKLILVQYFNYLTKKYLDKKIIIKKANWKTYANYDPLKDYYEEKLANFIKSIDSSQVFIVKKVTIKEPKSEYQNYYTPIFTLKNLNDSIKEIEFYRIKKDLMFWDEFKAKKDSLEKVRIAKVKLEQKQLELNKINKEKRRVERLNKYVKKYGDEYGKIVANYKVRIGMTKEMCEDSWGKPESINRTTNTYGTSEQWVYGGGNYLYFDNGKLTSIQN